MDPKTKYKLIIFVPSSHADIVRQTLGSAGAGKIGDYSYCSFSIKGITRFIPGKGANPETGTEGMLNEAEEERIETVCEEALLKNILTAVRKVHPYEEPAIDVYPIALIE